MGQRAPGPKTPERYETTGPNYDKWGEQPGYTYDPTTDRYKANQAPAGQPQRPQGKTNAAGLLKLGKHALDASGVTEAATSIPAGFTVAADGMTLVNPVTGAVQVGTAEGGGALMSDGTIVGAATEGGTFSLSGIGSAGNGILPAAGAVGAYDLARRDFKKNGAGYLRGIGQGAASGAAIGSYFGAPGAGIGAGIGGLIGLGKVAFGHKSTKDYQAERRKALIEQGVTGYEDYANQAALADEEYRREYGHLIENSRGARSDIPDDFIGIDTEGKYGPKGRWINEAFAATGDFKYLQPNDVTGQEGMFSTFGNDWLGKYTEDQRNKIARRLLDEGLLQGDKGDIIIHSKNQDRAKQIRDEIIGVKPEEEEEDRGEGPAPLDNPIV